MRSCDEEEEEMDDLLVIGAAEPFVLEDLEITMEDTFVGIHPEGQQTSVASPTTEKRRSSQR